MTGPGWEMQQQLLEREQWETMQETLRADPAYGEWLDNLNRSMNMDLDDLVKSKSDYLKKEDVNGEVGVNLTIRGFKKVMVESDGGEEEKIAMFFDEQNYKPLLLNITNKNRLKLATGESTVEGVKGKRINVYNDAYVEFGGKIVGGVRIRGATGGATDAKPGLSESDIPF